MDDKLCLVQLLHPGDEHKPDAGPVKHWTVGDHKRKFLLTSGRYLDEGVVRSGDLMFWGEWEAQSEVVANIVEPVPHGPRWVYRPFYAPPSSYRNLQNTDPFVFGDCFHYTGCLQHTRRGPTQLRNLARGSVILFGSSIRSAFCVDTVFVVNDFVDHSMRDFRVKLRGRVSHVYKAVTLAPWYGNMLERDKVFRLYFGATHDAPVDGMFSFFPCLPATDGAAGFARPQVRIAGVITPSLTQNKKLSCPESTGEMKALWDETVRQITDQGLMLGIEAGLPPAEAIRPPGMVGTHGGEGGLVQGTAG